MSSAAVKIVFRVFIVSVVVFLAGFLLFKYALPDHYFAFYPFLVLFFFLVNAGFLVVFARSVKETGQQFIRSYMMYTVIKLVIYLILIIVYIVSTRESAIPFAVTTGVLYLIYTVYDITLMTDLLKQKE